MRAAELWEMDRAELARVFRAGHPIDEASLDDSEYRGTSLGLPRFVERLTWKKFKKVFHRDPKSGVLRGWNVRLEQNGLEAPSIPKLRNQQAISFGHYRVVASHGRKMPIASECALLLDYGLGENRSLDFMRFVRDPIVAVNPGDAGLLLGWMYLEIGALRLATPSFFTLEREGPLKRAIAPPRRARLDRAASVDQR